MDTVTDTLQLISRDLGGFSSPDWISVCFVLAVVAAGTLGAVLDRRNGRGARWATGVAVSIVLFLFFRLTLWLSNYRALGGSAAAVVTDLYATVSTHLALASISTSVVGVVAVIVSQLRRRGGRRVSPIRAATFGAAMLSLIMAFDASLAIVWAVMMLNAAVFMGTAVVGTTGDHGSAPEDWPWGPLCVLAAVLWELAFFCARLSSTMEGIQSGSWPDGAKTWLALRWIARSGTPWLVLWSTVLFVAATYSGSVSAHGVIERSMAALHAHAPLTVLLAILALVATLSLMV